VKRVVSARCEWTPLRQSYDLDAIESGANAKRAQSSSHSDLPYHISSCGVRTTLLRNVGVFRGGKDAFFELDVAFDGKRYFARLQGGGECVIEESDVRAHVERSLADLSLSDEARRELLSLVRITTTKTVKNVYHNPFF